MYNTTYRTYKEINSKHDMVCIESIVGVVIRKTFEERKRCYLEFDMGTDSCYYASDYFDTEEEAIEFRNKLLSNELEVKQ